MSFYQSAAGAPPMLCHRTMPTNGRPVGSWCGSEVGRTPVADITQTWLAADVRPTSREPSLANMVVLRPFAGDRPCVGSRPRLLGILPVKF